MPLLQIQTSAKTGATADLLQTLSGERARELGKPESYVMIAFENDAQLLFGGTSEPACFAALKNIGTFTPSQTEHLRAREWVSRSKIVVEAPGWRGATKAHTAVCN